ncbi:hypothetical protein LR48_Vigan04g081100 [Vigna angularis]|uniref:Uncharacterized protein n=1 Tax=Phaseolus angularis TaxID=3914 RepID=A0A0L9UCY0_PHAAN|nr:hypothetical protein LR48_Vigan04g081100 [Vigna angularis]
MESNLGRLGIDSNNIRAFIVVLAFRGCVVVLAALVEKEGFSHPHGWPTCVDNCVREWTLRMKIMEEGAAMEVH